MNMEKVDVKDKKGVRKKFACSVTVGTKGQIVIPKEMREMFGIESGDSLLLLADIKKGIAVPPKNSFNEIFAKIFGNGAENPDGGQ